MIIDIRDKSRYMMGHIKNAVSIPFLELSLHPEKYLNFDNTYYLYCDTGSRSYLLVSYLNQMGYHCVNLDGGYSNYLLR